MNQNEKPTILVVDDEAAIQDVVAMALELEGCNVMLASSRDHALELIKETPPHAIFLDCAMPGLTIEPFLQQVRVISPSTLVILMTAATCAARKAEELRVPSYLAKPFEINALTRCVRHWMASA